MLSFPIFIGMKNEQKFFVYVDFREDDGKPFYVGKGVEKRAKDLHRNPLHTNIKNKHGMVRKIVFEAQSEQEAFQKEIELIQELKTHIDFDEGGANLTLGGEGSSGYKFTDELKKQRSEIVKKLWEDPEYREKMSEMKKDPVYREKMKERNKKAWENPEYRKKRNESHRKTCEDPEHKKIRSETSKKMWEDPENREKMSETIKKTWENPEYREKMKEIHDSHEFKKKTSESGKKKWENPEFKEKMKEIHDSHEHKKKLSESGKRKWEDPEFRAKHLEACKKAWEIRRLKISSLENLDIPRETPPYTTITQ